MCISHFGYLQDQLLADFTQGYKKQQEEDYLVMFVSEPVWKIYFESFQGHREHSLESSVLISCESPDSIYLLVELL